MPAAPRRTRKRVGCCAGPGNAPAAARVNVPTIAARGSERRPGRTAMVKPIHVPAPQAATVAPQVVALLTAIAACGMVTYAGSAGPYDATPGSLTCFGNRGRIRSGAQCCFSMPWELTVGSDLAATDVDCALNPSGPAHDRRMPPDEARCLSSGREPGRADVRDNAPLRRIGHDSALALARTRRRAYALPAPAG